MKQTDKNKKNSVNALDVTVILLLVLVVLGVAGRVLLDRHNSRGLEERQISFTCVLPQIKSEQIKQGAELYTASGNKLGSVTSIVDYVTESEEEDKNVGYILVTGVLNVRGYEQKNGVFCTADGDELRINTEISLKNGKNVHFYINDIVKNGQ